MKTDLQYKKLPDTPGVYIMKDGDGRILYVGKAANLRRRVSSYFERPHDIRIQTLVSKIKVIEHRETDTALEALILEAELIKTLTPPFNVREKDDKSFLYVEITKEPFPRVLLVRGKDIEAGKRYGPFTSASSVRQAMRILRKIFPWSTHDSATIGKFKRPCFDYEVGLCPGTCVGAVTRGEYAKNIERLKLFMEGKKKKVLKSFEDDMKAASKKLEFEKAERLRRQCFALQHIRDTAFIADSQIVVPGSPDVREGYRIEGYDISNISGTSAVGSMVVFENAAPNKDEYRKFKIKTIFEPNDVGMLREVLERRFSHSTAGAAIEDRWPLPDLVLIDGGLPQVNVARRVIFRAGLKIPVVGIAKGPERKRNDVLGMIPKGVTKETLVKVRDEAHRFAINYHKKLRAKRSINE